MTIGRIPFVKSAAGLLLAAALCLDAGVCATAQAAVVDEARLLLLNHDSDKALQLLTPHLEKQPKDYEALFLLGLAQTQQHRDKEAMAVYARLIKEQPQWPEPYNNLAALLARSGELLKARALLESAAAREPGYTKLQRNLADIYLLQAQDALSKARGAPGSDLVLEARLQLLSELTGRSVAAADATPAVATAIPGETRVQPVSLIAPAPVRAQPDPSEWHGLLLDLLRNWRDAQLKQDAARFTALYDTRYQPAAETTHEAWASAESERLAQRKLGGLTIENLQLKIAPQGRGEARFELLALGEDGQTQRTPRRLGFALQEGRWLISSDDGAARH